MECERCNITYLCRDDLISHHCNIVNNTAYKCVVCGPSFASVEDLMLHLKVHKRDSMEEDNYNCYVCNDGFQLRDELNRHMVMHKTLFKCIHCNMSFHAKVDLRLHMLGHKNELKFRKSESNKNNKIGNRQTKKETSYSKEDVPITKKRKTIDSTYLEEVSNNGDILDENIIPVNQKSTMHANESSAKTNQTSCCGVVVNTKCKVELVRLQSEKFKCKKCAATFNTTQGLGSHTRWYHNSNRGFKSFEIKNGNKSHSDCQKEDIKPVKKVQSHRRISSKKSSISLQKYSCKFCKKKFLFRMSLVEHLCTHIGVSKEECEKQSESIKSGKLLQRKVRSYHCRLCFKNLDRLSRLVEHIEMHMSVLGKKEMNN